MLDKKKSETKKASLFMFCNTHTAMVIHMVHMFRSAPYSAKGDLRPVTPPLTTVSTSPKAPRSTHCR